MNLRTILLEFRRDPIGTVISKDPEIHALTLKFCQEKLVQQPNLADDFARVWAAVEFDENDNPVSVQGVLGYRLTADVTLCRTLNPKAFSKLHGRANSFFADNGARGMEALVYVNPDEDPRQKCPDVEGTLKAIGAKPANRWSVTIK